MSQSKESQECTHILSVLVENEFGVLARVAQLFAARGFNIDSLTVGTTHDETMSRMTIVVNGDASHLDQVRKQLHKLVEVVAVSDLSSNGGFLARELMMIKVGCTPTNRVDIMQIGQLFDAKAIDYTPGSITFQLIGVTDRLDNFILFLQEFGIKELARSGVVGMNRGGEGIQSEFKAELEETEAS